MPAISLPRPKMGSTIEELTNLMFRYQRDLQYLLEGHIDDENIRTLSGLTELNNNLELDPNGKLRPTHKPDSVWGIAEYTDTIPVTFDVIERIDTGRAYFPFRLLILTIRNRTNPEKFIEFKVDPYTAVGIATGVNSNGKVIKARTNAGVVHGQENSANTIGYGVGGTGTVGIKLLDMLNTGTDKDKIRIELIGYTAPQSLNIYVDWILI